jgi:hypothetical protein
MMAGLAATACGGKETDSSCAEVACPGGEYCVDGRCVAGSHADGGKPGSDASNLDVGPFDDATQTEASECFAQDFPWSNTQESFVVPAGVTWMHVKAWGGGANQEGTCPGGVGGYAEASFPVSPGTELVFIVGAPGTAGDEVEQFRTGFGMTGGSGLTGVFSGPGIVKADEHDRAWIIAGGGGGAGVKTGGPCIPGIPGNHDLAGGMTTMAGGLGLDDNVNGGGGGYLGGKGGAKGERGLGGTGHVDMSRAADGYTTAAEEGSEAPPNTGDADYVANAGSYEQPGLLVVKFMCDKPVIEPPK